MKNKTTIIVMGIIITALLGIVLYSFVLIPTLQDYILNKQVDAQNQIIAVIVNEVITNGYIQIPVGDEVLILVPYQEPIQQTNLEW